MNKLLQLKDWLTFEEAAVYLQRALNEGVVIVKDIVDLVIQEKLESSLFLPYEMRLQECNGKNTGYVSGLIDVVTPRIESYTNFDVFPGDGITVIHKGEIWSFQRDDQGSYYLINIPFGGLAPPIGTQHIIRTKALNDLLDKMSDTKSALRIRDECRARGMDNKSTVQAIDAALSGNDRLTDAKMGYLFGVYNENQHEAARKNGRRLREKK